MAVVYNDTLKTNRMQLMSDLVAGKTFTASTGSATAGKLVIGDGTLNGFTNATIGVLATIPLATAPFVVSGAGTVIATLQTGATTAAASATGTASKCELRNSSDAPVLTGLTVGVGGGFDVNLGTTAITSGGTVTITSVSKITHG